MRGVEASLSRSRVRAFCGLSRRVKMWKFAWSRRMGIIMSRSALPECSAAFLKSKWHEQELGMKRAFAAAALLFASTTLFAADSATAPASNLPPAEADAKARLNSSPRHGEFIDIEVPGSKTPLRC